MIWLLMHASPSMLLTTYLYGCLIISSGLWLSRLVSAFLDCARGTP